MNMTVQLSTPTPTPSPQTPHSEISNVVRKRIRTLRHLRGVYYAHLMHMQITRYCLHIIFSRSKFPTQYDRLSQQQPGFLFSVGIVRERATLVTQRENSLISPTRPIGYALYQSVVYAPM